MIRREFLRSGSGGVLAGLLPLGVAQAQTGVPESRLANAAEGVAPNGEFDVRRFGATGDGHTLDTPAVNRAIEAAAAAGGGTVVFSAGVYACYTIRLKSHVSLWLQSGATILAASVPDAGTTTGGYDPAGPPQAWEAYQDYGHNHWPNSLIYGESLENVSIFGDGLIWGKGLSRGEKNELPLAESPGVGNKAISLKNCRNVQLRGFSMLKGGHFAILLTGVDNVVIDGLTIDTNRDGMDIDCCRNVRVSNCAVNSPWDDGICPKSSYALGYIRPTVNVTITNCYVTGAYAYGTLLDGTFVRKTYDDRRKQIGRIKCGTESNGGFIGITISNCVFDHCRGLALETVDGAIIEDIAISNISLRGCVDAPLFFRLGTRLRGPAGTKPGVLRRVTVTNLTSSDGAAKYPVLISGVPGHPIEDIKIAQMFVQNAGGGAESAEWAKLTPPELENGYPDSANYGPLPARGYFLRHIRNIEFTNVEVQTAAPDSRPAFWAFDVDGLDLFRTRFGKTDAPHFALRDVRAFRSFGSVDAPDRSESAVSSPVSF